MFRNRLFWLGAQLTVIGAVTLFAGCQSDLLNPEFVSDAGLGRKALPGNAGGLVLVSFENRTGLLLEPSFSFGALDDDPGNDGSFIVQLELNQKLGNFINCSSVRDLTVGDVENLGTPSGFTVGGTDFRLENVRNGVAPFGRVLTNGIDFFCGDNIVFVYTPARIDGSYQVTAYVYVLVDEPAATPVP